ncbi:DsbA family protein [Chloroflexota bacterium]
MMEQRRYWILALGLLILALALVGCQVATDRTAAEVARTDEVPAPIETIEPDSTVEEVASPAPDGSPTPDLVASPTLDESPTPDEIAPKRATETATQEEPQVSGAEGEYQEGFTEEGEPFKGSLAADVVIEEFSSYQCPYCGKYFSETYPQIMANYVETGQVLYVYRDFPLQTQPQSPIAAQAASCAAQVGRSDAFWQMHDRLFENQRDWSGQGKATAIFKGYAADLGLDEAIFDQCLDSQETLTEVEADAEEGISRGVRGTPTFFISGQALVGAQPYSAFARALDAVLAGETLPGAEAAGPDPAPTPATVSPSDSALVLGAPDAPVTIVEFSDYQCPFCARHFQQTWPRLKADFVDTGRVRYVFKDFPITSIHPQAPKAHEAARCAGEQGAYWEMHDRIFDGQSEWAGERNHVELLKGYALELRLDTAAFDSCLDNGRWTEDVESDLDEGVALGVRGTPTFFIDGYPLVGAQPYEVFQQAIAAAEEGTLGETLQASP